MPGIESVARPLSDSEQIARLERRVARERAARRAAESISEQGLLSLFRQQERLALLQSIAAASNLGDDPDEAFSKALAHICAFTRWPLGHVWMFADDDRSVLTSSGVWFAADELLYRPLQNASAELVLPPGVGLPGRVLETGRPLCLPDVVQDPNFPRSLAAKASGLRGGFAFPALIGDEVGAVLEFFQHQPETPSDDLLEILDQIGIQLGRVVERYRNNHRLKTHNADLEALNIVADTQRQAAEAANQAKSAFLAVTSHEIRTPLNAVLGLAHALQSEPLTPHQHELNEGVLASGAMLLRLLNAVLDLSKIEAGSVTPELADFDIRDKLDTVAAIWRPHAKSVGVDLMVQTDDLDVASLRSDEGRIVQTIVNLVSNAVKFTPPGGAVLIRAASTHNRLRLEIIDGGQGVDVTDIQRVFLPYEQTAAGREAGGAGLGLSICAGNVRLLGGEIGGDRTPEGHSRFYFECPIVKAIPSLAAAQGAAKSLATTPLRVLAAEDNLANQRVLQVLLAQANVDLTLVGNGAEAVAALRSDRYDLILMDANMPVMSGPDAVRMIRSEGLAGGAGLHMLTANAFPDDIALYRAAGADGVLTKPINVPELFATLAAAREPEQRLELSFQA